MTSSAPAAQSPPPAAPAPARGRTFAAFISYSHKADQALATALHGALHRFAKPWNRLRAVRIARDKATMDAASNLWGTIARHVDDSEHLILLASTASARSPWVPREIEQFLRTHGPDRIVVVLTEGEIAWDAAAGDFDWARTTALPRMERPLFASEPRYVDLRRVRQTGEWSNRNPEFREAVAEISATIRGISKDELVGQDVREHRRTRRLARTGVAALTLLAIGLGIAALVAVRKTRESTRRLAGTYVANGVRLVEDGDPAGALPWFAAAWRLEQGDEARRRMHRLRFGATLARTGRLERAWWAEQPVWRTSFSPDGRLALITTGDVPDVVEAELYRPEDGGHAAGDSIPEHGGVVVWNVAAGRPDGAPLRHAGAITSARFTPDGRGILTASFDGTARLWDAATRRELRAWRLPAAVNQAELSADGSWLLTVTDAVVSRGDGSAFRVPEPVRVWPVRGDGPARTPRLPFAPLAAWFSPDGRRVAVQSEGALAVWEPETGRVRVLPLPGIEALGGVRWSPDGSRLAAAITSAPGWRRSVVVLDAATGQVQARTMEMEQWPGTVAFSPDGTLLLTAGGWVTEAGSGNGEARVWNTRNGEPASDWHSCPQSFTDAAFAPGGRWVAVACDDGTVSVWPAWGPDDTGEPADTAVFTQSVLHVGAPVRALAFSPADARLLTLSGDRGVRLWDVARRDLGPARVRTELALDASDTAAGPWTVEPRGGADGADTVVILGPGKAVAHRTLHPGNVQTVTFAPDGRRFATVGSDDSVRVWDAASGTRVGRALMHPLLGHEYFSLQPRVRFSPDGRTLATASSDLSVRVWDVETGRPRTPLLWPAPGVMEHALLRGVAFVRGGSVVAAGVFQEGGRMWDARTGELLARLERGWTVDLLPDGTVLASRGAHTLPWRLEPYPGSLDEAAATAALLAHARMDDLGGTVPLSGPEFRERWRARADSASRP
jgi:WD40 repeat protein